MKKLVFLIAVFSALVTSGQNSISRIYVPDIARDWVIVNTAASVGVTTPATSQFSVNSTTPAEVKLINDTAFGVRMGSSFSIGQSITFTYTASGGLLGSLPTITSRSVNNQVTAGVVHNWTTSGHTNIFLGMGVDFNTTYSIDSGDIISLAPGDYGSFDVSKLTGVRIVSAYSSSGDSVRFSFFNVREETVDVGLSGHPAMKMPIKIRNNYVYFGIGCFATGYLWFENLEIYHVKQGIQVKTVSDLLFPPYNLSRRNYQRLVTRYDSVHNTAEECFYIGSDVAAPLIPISWTGYGLACDSAGRDAYQYRNGDWVYLKNCTMTHIGLEGNTDHSHGFLFGTTTKGGWVENITGSNIGGNGMLINGYGTLTVKNCTISSYANNPYVKNYDDFDSYSMGGLTLNFVCNNSFNSYGAGDPRTPDIRRDPAKLPMTINISSGTTFLKPNYIEDGVHGGVNNGIVVNFTENCPLEESGHYLKLIPQGTRILRFIH